MLTCKIRWGDDIRYLVAKIDSLETLKSEIQQLFESSDNIYLQYVDADDDYITVTNRDRWSEIGVRMKHSKVPVFCVVEAPNKASNTAPVAVSDAPKKKKHAYRVILAKDGANALAHNDPVAPGSMVACQCELENISEEQLPKNVSLMISGSKLSRDTFSFHDSSNMMHVESLSELAPGEKAVVVMKLRVSESAKGPCKAFIKVVDTETKRPLGPVIRASVVVE